MDRSKKYGLQLRAPPNQKKPTRPPLPNALAFNDEDDDDNVEREILRQAQKNKTHKDVEDLHKKALEEDPMAFDYDRVYEKMKEEQVRPLQIDRKDRESRYIAKIKEKAKQREREQEIIYERKLAKERNKDEHMFADKDKFVTGAYKRKLAEQEKWKEEERLRELKEEKDDVTKKTDISDFYFNLSKNVAFGANDADLGKPKKQPEKGPTHSPKKVPVSESDTTSEPSTLVKGNRDQIVENPSSKEKSNLTDVKLVSATPGQDQAEPPAGEETRPNHHKKSVDAVAAAKERFLARKKAKVQ